MKNLSVDTMGSGCLMLALALAALPAAAQEATPAPRAEVDTRPVDPVTPPRPREETKREAAEDAQLPAYLQDQPGAEARSAAFDPWEHYNRRVFRFNQRADAALIKPLAQAYVRDVPRPVRNRVSDFHQNLMQPVTMVNLLLQGHPASATKSLGRFAVNSTVGLAGLFDPASRMHLARYREDFGQTLGHWGWRRSRYFLIPMFGPGTVRDRLGSIADSQLGTYRVFQPLALRVGVTGLVLLDTRVQAMPMEALGADVADAYVLVRDAWTQRRMHQIDDQNADATDDPDLVAAPKDGQP